MRKVLEKYFKNKRNCVWCGIILSFLVGIFFFYSFVYRDILITTRHGMNLWTCLSDGRIFDFFKYNDNAMVETYTEQIQGGAYYDFPIYIIFAIWNLPMKIVEKFTGINVFQSLPCLMWMKSILIVFVLGSLAVLEKIARLLDMDEEKINALFFMFLSSAVLASTIIMIGQYDIIAIFFMLCGIYFYLQKKPVGFLLFFMLAVPLKMFSLFCFLALLLYKEKNWLKIIGNIFCVLFPIGVFRILIPFSQGSNDVLIPMFLLSNGRGISLASVPAVIIPIVIAYAVCYMIRPAEADKDFHRETIYICFAIYAILFGCIVAHPYWIIYLSPFAELIILSADIRWFRINITLETFFSLFYIVAQMFKYPGCYASDIVGNMLVAYISGNIHLPYNGRTILDYINRLTSVSDMLNETNIMIVSTGIFVALLLLFAVVNCPFIPQCKYRIVESKGVEWKVLCVRLIFSYLLCLVPLSIYLSLYH